MKNFFEKIKYQSIIFLLRFKTYAGLLAKEWITKVLYKIALQNFAWFWISKMIFYRIFLLILKELFS
jgi:hypothetical protein